MLRYAVERFAYAGESKSPSSRVVKEEGREERSWVEVEVTVVT